LVFANHQINKLLNRENHKEKEACLGELALHFYPESMFLKGRSSDLLPFDRLPNCWITESGIIGHWLMELTAAGTVSKSHRIPF